MTNSRQARNNGKRGGNRKDGQRFGRHQTKVQRNAAETQWLAAGFSRKWIRNAPRLIYTWDHPDGIFPVFEITPGIITDNNGTYTGMVARYPNPDKEILFTYGTPPADIAARLDDEIFAIMRHDAEIDDAPFDREPTGAGDWMIS